MAYRIVFEYQTETTAMNDIYNHSDKQAALTQFAELREMLKQAISPDKCQIVDEHDLFGLVNHDEGYYGFVRLDED